MKKLTLVMILTIMSVLCVYAQENGQKGTNLYQSYVGGGLSLNANIVKQGKSDSEVKHAIISIAPVIGLRVDNDLFLGLAMNFTHIERSFSSNDPWFPYYFDIQKMLSFGLFLRTHSNLSEKLKIYYEPYAGRTFYIKPESDNDLRDYFMGINAGILYFVQPRFSIEMKVAGFQYNNSSYKDSDFVLHSFSLDYVFIEHNLGLKFYF